MSKELYEEALADVKKVKELAEANAQKAVLDVVTPRIRRLIETQLMSNDEDEDDEDVAPPGAPKPEGELMTDDVIVAPSSQDKNVTVDLGVLNNPTATGTTTGDIGLAGIVDQGIDTGDEFEVDVAAVDALAPVAAVIRPVEPRLGASVRCACSDVAALDAAATKLPKKEVCERIDALIARFDNIYEHVQGPGVDPQRKALYETELEKSFTTLTGLQESMKMSIKKTLKESDVTLKLTGLPDDVDLESVGVDLIKDEEEGGDEELEVGTDDELGGEEGGEGEEDLGGDEESFDFDGEASGEDEGMEDEDEKFESAALGDDVIVEIDEGMLRKEIARLKMLREAKPGMAKGAPKGTKAGTKQLKAFGGGKKCCEADVDDTDEGLTELDDAVPGGMGSGGAAFEDETTEDSGTCPTCGAPMQETDAPLGESDDGDEDLDSPAEETFESINRKLAFESKMQKRARNRIAQIKEHAIKARSKKNVIIERRLRKEHAEMLKALEHSQSRAKKLRGMLTEVSRKNELDKKVSSKNDRRLVEGSNVVALRAKLAETNLINTKLQYTTKLLQSEQLTSRQRTQVVEQLNAAKTPGDAKLVYERLVRSLNSGRRQLDETNVRRSVGSSSQVTRSSSTETEQLSEGYEMARWATLAGITK